MNPYFFVFKLSISRVLTHRLDFFIGRIRTIMVMFLLYYVWMYLSTQNNSFASYSTEQLITYVFGINILRSCIFGAQSRQIASEINDGTFSGYLVKPISVWKLFYFRELGERVVLFITALMEVGVFLFLLDRTLLVPQHPLTWLYFVLALLGAHFLYFFLSLLLQSLAFWTREAMGPRFLFEWILELSSGAYFPIDILTRGAVLFLGVLPFFYVLFFPMQIYLEQQSFHSLILSFLFQMLWLLFTGLLATFVWKKGLKKYSGEGI